MSTGYDSTAGNGPVVISLRKMVEDMYDDQDRISGQQQGENPAPDLRPRIAELEARLALAEKVMDRAFEALHAWEGMNSLTACQHLTGSARHALADYRERGK